MVMNSLLSFLILIVSFQANANVKAIKDSERRKPAGVLQRELRLEHARELLGKHYKRSAVRSGEGIKKINAYIYEYAKNRLPKKYRSQHEKIAQTIIDTALKYEFDPVFLLAVIQGESSFNPEMNGKAGEIGLMQILPSTGEWIAGLTKQKWSGKRTLRDPIRNIKLGAAFLDHLRTKFDSHAQLYLAAYNMGARNVNNALDKDIWPKDYPTHVMKIYVEFYTELSRTERSIAAEAPPRRSASRGT